MTPQELLDKCNERLLDWATTPGAESAPLIDLVLPWQASGEYVRLCKTHGPRGRAINWRLRGEHVYTWAFFDARKVKAWLLKQDAKK